MNRIYIDYLCKCLSSATSTGVRLFKGSQCLSYNTVYDMNPDPVGPYLKEIMQEPEKQSIYVTPLYQYFGCMHVGQYCIIIGPTVIKNDDDKKISQYLFALNVKADFTDAYVKMLKCAPDISMERMTWTIALLQSALIQKQCPAENIKVNMLIDGQQRYISEKWKLDAIHEEITDDQTLKSIKGWNQEQLITMYIENGNVKYLKDYYERSPKMDAGPMAGNTIRQLKNMVICGATVFSRAAIRGGMNQTDAFRLSDQYIQQAELCNNAIELEKLLQNTAIGFAENVELLKNGKNASGAIFNKCAIYITKHIYEKIKISDMAHECGYSRSYLSSSFSKETGLSLEQYIINQKMIEACQMLALTKRSLSDIASQLCFSSQSHFQTVFKKTYDMTPMEYRIKHK